METLRLFVVEVSYCRSSNLVRISDIILYRPAGIFVMTADVIAVGPGRGGTAYLRFIPSLCGLLSFAKLPVENMSSGSYTPSTDLWLERSRLNGMILGAVSYGWFHFL